MTRAEFRSAECQDQADFGGTSNVVELCHIYPEFEKIEVLCVGFEGNSDMPIIVSAIIQ